MFNFLQIILGSVVSFFTLISSPFVGNPAITPTPTPVPMVEMVKAAGTYSSENRSVSVSMDFPKAGGVVKGTLDGDCTGTLNGFYLGGENGDLSGSAAADCTVAIFHVTASANLSGKVSLDQKKVDLNFEGKAADYTHNGSITLNFLE